MKARSSLSPVPIARNSPAKTVSYAEAAARWPRVLKNRKESIEKLFFRRPSRAKDFTYAFARVGASPHAASALRKKSFSIDSERSVAGSETRAQYQGKDLRIVVRTKE